ncbi:MAG TPA: plastocyanin/azurin family copper-binding protein [Candidatus Limnocylindrales bacterium]|nr:plastocyanin/azurin family copper-binding protein [Candidatus Limnocylindrales bacterium]
MKTFTSAIPLRRLLLLAALIIPQALHAETWHATVGAQNPDKGRQALAFLPNEIWIHAGDSITWTFAADEIHTLTFLQPAQVRPPFQVGCPGVTPSDSSFDGTVCVNSGTLVEPSTYTVMFPSPGNFKLVCLVHPNMTGVVHVLNPSEPLPHDQAFYDRLAAAEARDLITDADHSGSQSVAAQSSGNNVTAGTGEIVATAGGQQTLSVVRFIQPTTVIHAGETVEWANSDPVTPHTVTFGAEPANPIPPSGNVTVDADGALHAVINSPSDSVHSGLIMAAPQERTGLAQSPISVTRFRVTFTSPGTYPFICVLHDDLGMMGKVVVLK